MPMASEPAAKAQQRAVIAGCREACAAVSELAGYLTALESCVRMSGGHTIPEDHRMVERKFSAVTTSFVEVGAAVRVLLDELKGSR